MLHNLLALHLDNRFLALWQALHPVGSAKAKGRTGDRRGNADQGQDVGEVRCKSVGSRV